MKKIIFLLSMIAGFPAFIAAQNVVEVTEAGTLQQAVEAKNFADLHQLKVIGPLNGTDIRYLSNLSGNDWDWEKEKLSNDLILAATLEDLDLSEAQIVQGDDAYSFLWLSSSYETIFYTKDNEVTPYFFWNCRVLRKLKLPKVNKVTKFFCWPNGLSNLTELWITAKVTEDVCFSSSGMLEKLVLCVDSLGFRSFTIKGLKQVVSLTATPPRMGERVLTFASEQELLVPAEAVEAYRQAEGWNRFKEIRAYADGEYPTNINTPRLVRDEQPDGIYNLNGQRLTAPQPGVNIVNGKKVFVGR